MRTIKTIVVTVVSLMLPSLSAQPADLNFDPIAVIVTQLYSDVKEVRVSCDVKDAAGNWITDTTYIQAANTTNPATGNLDATKSFSGNLQTGLNFNNSADMANAKTFVCQLQLTCFGQCGGLPAETHLAEMGDESKWFNVKGGTLSIEGPIWPGYSVYPVKTIEAVGHSRF